MTILNMLKKGSVEVFYRGANIRELIDYLRSVENKDKSVKVVDMETHEVYDPQFIPISYRGEYDKPATIIERHVPITVEEAIKLLKRYDGAVVVGYKGGEFTLSDEHNLRFVHHTGEAANRICFMAEETDECVYLYLFCPDVWR